MKYIMIHKKLYKLLMSFLFEKDALLSEIEEMDAETFRLRAEPAKNSPRSLFSYKDPLVKAVVWNMKFRKNRKCFTLAGKLLYPMIPSGYLIIPVPISSKRRRDRGYNQAEILAEEIKNLDKEGRLEIGKDLIVKKHVPAQTSLLRKKRMENMKGVFIVTKPEKIRGRDIVVLDDVITTGATVGEMSRVFKEAGAARITAISFAH
jgi:ComF family protein